jgi:acyl carrier protein
MNIEQIIRHTFSEILESMGSQLNAPLEKDTVLLGSGLDSLGFAILVARLEESLGYDPFIRMEEPVYPQTFGDFLNIYEKYQPAP